MALYRVKQGDHLSGLAQRFGFRDFDTIWNDPANAELKETRADPHVLLPGDALFIPEKKPKTVDGATGLMHPFVVKTRPLLLRIALKDFDSQPIPNADCELEIAGAMFKLKSNAQGVIETAVDTHAQEGTLRIPALDLEHRILIGHLDPVEAASGWRARLINLGYYAGSSDDSDEARLRHAIEEFQCDHGLHVTGELDAATRSKLAQRHGV
jgi:N-acetylmuramoyl-L-alanine amidase